MTTPRPDATDYLTLVASVRDKESLQLMARILEGHLTVMQAELAQLQQLQTTVQERLRNMG